MIHQMEEIRGDYMTIEIKEKEKMEELYKGGLQDARYLVKQGDQLKSESENEIAFLKKQVIQLTNDRIRIQQNTLALEARVSHAEHDILETGDMANSQ
jgi:hypothetical protein